jgi:hypothetical protein
MIEDERLPDGKSSTTEPNSPTDADCRGNGGNREVSVNPSGPESFVAAFSVTREYDGSLRLSAPLSDGGTFSVVTSHGVGAALDLIPRLPIKDLANPLVALVTRPSFERLVKAARMALAANKTACAPLGEMDELRKALEAFEEVGNA